MNPFDKQKKKITEYVWACVCVLRHADHTTVHNFKLLCFWVSPRIITNKWTIMWTSCNLRGHSRHVSKFTHISNSFSYTTKLIHTCSIKRYLTLFGHVRILKNWAGSTSYSYCQRFPRIIKDLPCVVTLYLKE